MSYSPVITITGKIQDFLGNNAVNATVSVRLVNYGSDNPRVPGSCLISDPWVPVTLDGSGGFSFTPIGNDVIVPSSTYYELKFTADNANTASRTTPYQFTGSGTQELSQIIPFNQTAGRFNNTSLVDTSWRGPWDSSTTYVLFNSVSYNGSSYVAVATSTNVVPGTDNTKWNLLASIGGLDPTLELAVYVPGLFNSSQEVISINVVRAFTLPSSLTGSLGTLKTAPAGGSFVFTLKKNGSSIGTLTFGVGSTSGTFSFASSQSFVVADVFSISAPAVQDSAAAGLAVTMLGTKN